MTRTLTANQIADIAASKVARLLEDPEFSLVYEDYDLQDISEEQQLEIFEAMNSARVRVEVDSTSGLTAIVYNYDVEEDCE